jgi:hypothetical protein
MKIIYSPQNGIEAGIVKGLLEASGIDATINGHYLSGAIGELPAMGMITISVREAQAEGAKKLIAEYERA